MDTITELIYKYWKSEKQFIEKVSSIILRAEANSFVVGNTFSYV